MCIRDSIRRERITEGVPDFAQVWRVLYRSTGVNGEPVMVSGLIAVPDAPRTAEPLPVLAFAQGTIGNRPQCGLSHTSRPVSAIPGFETMLREGYVVAATDYIGRGTPGVHPYLLGRAAAYAVLDSVRAARQIASSAGSDFVVWGRSQGGHSVLWTAMLAESYAPEIKLIGAAASAPAIYLEDVLRFNLDTEGGAVVITYALDAWAAYYDDISVEELVRAEFQDRFRAIADTCVTTPLAFLLLGTLPTPAQYLAGDVLADPAITRLLADNTPNGAIGVPLLITHGTGDTLIPFEGSARALAERCAAGENVQLVRIPGVNHDAANESALVTIGWFGDRFAGRPAPNGCP
jgi:alpha-beta hydrolase superfamily lysophospholipase